MRGSVQSLVCLILLLASTVAVQAERRVALVIGNGAYENASRLPNPRNDAEDVAEALKRTGFETIVGLDLTQSQMQEMAIRFSRVAREADVALFYYSGHAMQFAGVNYLMPVDATLRDEADLRRMARVDEIVADLQQAKSLRILVLDACRDNPLAEALKRSIGRTRAASLQRGLAKIESPEGMIVAFSTQAGRTADDGAGRNSPYTAAFLKHIETRQEIGRVFRRISADVYEATSKTQLPELSLSLIGEFYLRGRPAVASPETAAPLPQSPGAKAWDLVKDTTDRAVLEAFVKEYPDGLYAALARARLTRLEKDKLAARVDTPEPPDAAKAPARHPFDGRWKGTVTSLTGCRNNRDRHFEITVRSGEIDEPHQVFPKKGHVADNGEFVFEVTDAGGAFQARQSGTLTGDTGTGRFQGAKSGCKGTIRLARLGAPEPGKPDLAEAKFPFDGRWKMTVSSLSGCRNNRTRAFEIEIRSGRIDQPHPRFPKTGQVSDKGEFVIKVTDRAGRLEATQRGTLSGRSGKGRFQGRKPGCRGAVTLLRVD